MSILDNLLQNQIDFLVTPLGTFVFIFSYALWVTLLLPGSWISLVGGFLYGSLWGSIFVFIGAIVGAILTFLSGRYFFMDWIQSRLSKFPRLQLIEKSISKEGIKFIILTRLSPAFPFGLLNLAYGLSNIKFKDFVLGLIAIFPGTFLYCSIGSLANEISRLDEVLDNQNQPNSLIFSIIGIVATALVVLMIAKITQHSLKELN